jgi:rare lipoprotein A (peptidoglycan hydrolase)
MNGVYWMQSRARFALPGMAVAVALATLAVAPRAHAEPGPAPAAAPVNHAPAKPARKTVAAAKATPARATHATHATPATPVAAVVDDEASLPEVIRAARAVPTVWHQTGVASWYGGRRWQGNRTASGARYDEHLLTAAHATLPIGTRVRVTLEGSDRSVIVVINDRPGTRHRIIDLSRAAAENLGILHQGVAVVSLTTL